MWTVRNWTVWWPRSNCRADGGRGLCRWHARTVRGNRREKCRSSSLRVLWRSRPSGSPFPGLSPRCLRGHCALRQRGGASCRTPAATRGRRSSGWCGRSFRPSVLVCPPGCCRCSLRRQPVRLLPARRRSWPSESRGGICCSFSLPLYEDLMWVSGSCGGQTVWCTSLPST